MSVRRYTDPVYLQYIWNAILDVPNSVSGSTLQDLLSAIQSRYDQKCTSFKLQHELSNAIQDGCVEEDGGLYSLVEGFECIQKDRSDWYCFECHGPGFVVSCPTCFRVFHTDCLSASSETHWSCRLPLEDPTLGTNAEPDSEFPPDHPCPVCKRVSRARNSDETTSIQDLQKIFATALTVIRHRVSWKTMQQVGYLYEPVRNEYLVYRQINTRMIGDRLRAEPQSKSGYFNRTGFLVDLDNLVHNAAVFYGSKHVISNMARQIRSQMKRAMRESAYCVDCYLRSSSPSIPSRFTAACRKPHRLLWFQHNGWSFRPCKMLYENAEGYEVICFGGRHEREFVHRSRAFNMTFTAPELGLRMTPSLKKALDEAEEYKANQSAYDRSLPPTSELDTPTNLANSYNGKDFRATERSVTLPTDSTAVVKRARESRKRKAGPKYSSAFGTTDTESSVSAFSSLTASSSYKRRKSSVVSSSVKRPSTKRSNKVAKTVNRSSQPSVSVKEEYTNDNTGLSSLSSENESNDGSISDFRITKRSSNQKLCPASLNGVGKVDSPTGSSRRSTVCVNEVKTGSDRSAHSGASSCSVTNSKPLIRIKPLPPPKLDDQTVSVPKPSHKSLPRGPKTIGTTRSKPEPSTSSSSSALSCPSSGCATIPAFLSLDDPESVDSLHSFSSASSQKLQPRKIGRPPKRRLQLEGQKLKMSRTTESDVLQNDAQRTVNGISQITSVASDSNNPDQVSKTTTSTVRASRVMRSPSPLSSLSDCDSKSSSSSSSLLSHSRTPSPSSSSLSSSSSVSSTSTIPSPSRLTCYSTHNTDSRKNFNAFGHGRRVNSFSPASLKCGFSVGQPALPTAPKTEPSPALFCSLYNHSPSPTKPHQTLQSSLDCSSTDLSTTLSLHTSNGYSGTEPGRGTKSSKKKSYDAGSKTSKCGVVSPSQLPASTVSVPMQPNHQYGIATTAGGFAKSNNSMSWSSLTRLSAAYGSHTPMTHLATANPTSNPTGPTPPSSNSASSSCYSSVSPAALSTTSGLGSSLSDPKSVDASPGEVATMLGNTSFSCSSGGHTAIQSIPIQSDTVSYKSTEEQIHRIYADRLVSLIAERDQAREEISRRDQLIAKLRREHEAEIKRVKQMTWCQVCLNEAFYHCCPGTAYCSEPCQLRHWTEQHNRDCRRRGESQQLQQQQQLQQPQKR
ncbi:Zinc finger MYND domain-containing protein 11 [Clonorchis sinensis]|uniref:Zinc finger MYND domain-containing protein 11 n=1 Tax=Clonorchis sinensis TaxID=79923 RepID=A0A8T1MW76_CLOSI|nr:Zinc finger MYND domain-containing protein 11 [Clonorchis sinensis]